MSINLVVLESGTKNVRSELEFVNVFDFLNLCMVLNSVLEMLPEFEFEVPENSDLPTPDQLLEWYQEFVATEDATADKALSEYVDYCNAMVRQHLKENPELADAAEGEPIGIRMDEMPLPLRRFLARLFFTGTPISETTHEMHLNFLALLTGCMDSLAYQAEMQLDDEECEDEDEECEDEECDHDHECCDHDHGDEEDDEPLTPEEAEHIAESFSAAGKSLALLLESIEEMEEDETLVFQAAKS